jgi:hypothetical protein
MKKVIVGITAGLILATNANAGLYSKTHCSRANIPGGYNDSATWFYGHVFTSRIDAWHVPNGLYRSTNAMKEAKHLPKVHYVEAQMLTYWRNIAWDAAETISPNTYGILSHHFTYYKHKETFEIERIDKDTTCYDGWLDYV